MRYAPKLNHVKQLHKTEDRKYYLHGTIVE